MCREMEVAELIPRAAAGMIYLSARLLFVIGFAGDGSEAAYDRATEILANLSGYARRNARGTMYDYAGADEEGRIEEAVEQERNPYEGEKLNALGKPYTIIEEGSDSSSVVEEMGGELDDAMTYYVKEIEARVVEGIVADIGKESVGTGGVEAGAGTSKARADNVVEGIAGA